MRKKLQNITRNSLVCLLILSFVTGSVCACGRIKQEKRPNKDLTELTMVLDWTPNTEHTGLYVALKKGYFEKEGLDVTVVEPPEDGAISMVASGEAEFGIGFQDRLAENFSNDNQLPVVAVATLLQHNQIGLISMEWDGIDTPAQIPGHVLAVTDNVIEQTIVHALIEQAGGDLSQVRLEETYIDDVAETLGTNIQVVLGSYGWDCIACERKGMRVRYTALRDLDETFDYYGSLLIANSEFLTEKPDMAKAFIRAVRQGYQDAVLDPMEAARILLEQEPDLDKGLVESSQRYMSPQYIADSPEFGVIDAERWNRFYNWINAKGLYTSPIPENIGFTNEFLEE